MLLELTTAWTKPITFTLKSAGAAMDLTATTPAIIIRGLDGTTVDTAGDVSLLTPAAGKVRWSPDLADLPAGIYTLRIKITDSDGDTFFPSGRPVPLQVFPQ